MRRAGGFILALALLSGCGDTGPVRESNGAPAPSSERAASPLDDEELAPPVPTRVRPRPGTFAVAWHDDLLRVAANWAPRERVLAAVADAADFELVIDEPDLEWSPLTALIRDVPLTEALPSLVGDFTFRTEQEYDEESGTHRVVRVSVGVPLVAAAAEEAPAEVDPAEADPRRERPEWDRSEALGTLLREELHSRIDEDDPEALFWMLEDPDPVVRMRAALVVEPTGEGFDRLRHLLATDPDPRVRAATTASLETANGYATVKALVDALDDPDPEVVIEVIDSLAFAGDETNVADIAPFLTHPDPRIREVAGSAIDFLE